MGVVKVEDASFGCKKVFDNRAYVKGNHKITNKLPIARKMSV